MVSFILLFEKIMRMTRYLWFPILGLALAGCGNDAAEQGDEPSKTRAPSAQQTVAEAPELPAANGFVQIGSERFPLESASLRCVPRQTHDGISEIRFQTFGMGGEGMDAYNVSAREEVHRNGNVTQHMSIAGQVLGINIGSDGDRARENGRNWPLYTIESNRITVRAVVRDSEVLAEWDLPIEFTTDCPE